MNVPQLLGYARIAGMPLVTGLYTALPIPIAFAVFGSSRHLFVAADSGTAAILAGALTHIAVPGSAHYLSLAATTALLAAGMLLLARIFKLGFPADFLSRTVLVGFLAGVGVLAAEDCARRVIYQPVHAPQGNPIYHPTLVGDDFFLQGGAAVSINLAPPTGH